MKNIILLLCLVISVNSLAQRGFVKESVKVKSSILGKEAKYSIYLPAGYEKTNRSYPVLYLLHGYSDDETGWTQFGEVERIANQTISDQLAPDMIIVMPDAEVTWYLNTYDGKIRYEDFFFQEFIPMIEKTYRVRPGQQFRAIAGLSMGGYGTLLYALKHPDMFSAAVPLSAAVRTDQQMIAMADAQWENRYGFIFGPNLKGSARLTDHFQKNSILKLVNTIDVEKLKSITFYIDCGDDDHLITGNMALHSAMIDKKIPHEFRVRDGGHNWTYWRTALPEVMKFVGEAFTR